MIVPNSEFDIPLDYAIAATGQKTIINFINEMNSNNDIGELKATKWSDIDTKPATLQTAVRNIFTRQLHFF